MRPRPRRLSLCLVWTALALLASACASAPPPYRAHRDLPARLPGIVRVGLVAPDIRLHQVSAGGVRELRDDWNEAARREVTGALRERLQGALVELVPLEPAPELTAELDDVRVLYRAVGGSIVQHTYLEPFPHKRERFEYSVGPLEPLLERHRLDALLFVHGSGEFATAGRSAVGILGAVVLGAATGVVVVPPSRASVLTAALVDRSGTVLWFNATGGPHAGDPRTAAGARALVRRLLDGLPGWGR
ncbi:MAG TPA: hypothetical protein VNM66_09610 [Thermodesulfobacteriota bacterium]|nr:hypothetical protein [Thermodesulfobacteriota bacterium]